MHGIVIDEQLLTDGHFGTIRGQRRLLGCLMHHVGLAPHSGATAQHRRQRHTAGEGSCVDKITDTEPQGTGGRVESYGHAHYSLAKVENKGGEVNTDTPQQCSYASIAD